MSNQPVTRDYPQSMTPINHIEPVPRRIRATLGGRTVVDTVSALYVWEWNKYPQYYIPLADVDRSVLVDEQHPLNLIRCTPLRHSLQVDVISRPAAARIYSSDAQSGTRRHGAV